MTEMTETEQLKIDAAILTTDHSASCYGDPVLVLEGVAYGRGDKLPSGCTAAYLVYNGAKRLSAESNPLVRRFLADTEFARWLR